MHFRQSSSVVTVESSDHDELSELHRPLPIEFARARSGPFFGSLATAQLGPLTVRVTRLDTPVVTRGAVPRGHCALVVALRCSSPTQWLGHDVDPGFQVFYPGGAEHAGHSHGDLLAAILLAPRLELADAFARETGCEWDEHTPRFLPSDPELRARLHRTVRRAAATVASAPAALDLPQPRLALADELMRGLARVLASAAPGNQREAPQGRSARVVVERADDALRSRIAEPVYVRELCEAAGVSERTLRAAFHQIYGLAPTRYLLLRRLHAVRRCLRDDDTSHSVSAVAHRFGFWELGRFAAQYRALFGELPSQTARGSRAPCAQSL
jgi:AraC family ethanolamine operon transcriptional activator